MSEALKGILTVPCGAGIARLTSYFFDEFARGVLYHCDAMQAAGKS
jgi:hypothetical protein